MAVSLPGLRRGDVVNVDFPFMEDERRSKYRVALVVQNDIGNRYASTVIVAYITRTMSGKPYPTVYAIDDPATIRAAGLDGPSEVRLHILYTFDKQKIRRIRGHLPRAAMREADAALGFSLGLALR